jgi:hypothetical protein
MRFIQKLLGVNQQFECVLSSKSSVLYSITTLTREIFIPFIPHVGMHLVVDGIKFKVEHLMFDTNSNTVRVDVSTDSPKAYLFRTGWVEDENSDEN